MPLDYLYLVVYWIRSFRILECHLEQRYKAKLGKKANLVENIKICLPLVPSVATLRIIL